jgi:hypothetical protein
MEAARSGSGRDRRRSRLNSAVARGGGRQHRSDLRITRVRHPDFVSTPGRPRGWYPGWDRTKDAMMHQQPWRGFAWKLAAGRCAAKARADGVERSDDRWHQHVQHQRGDSHPTSDCSRAGLVHRVPPRTCSACPGGGVTRAAQAEGRSASRNGLRGGDGFGCSASSVNHQSSSLPQPSPGGGGA